jgi:DNA primase
VSLDVPRLLARLGIVATRQGREWVAICPNPGHKDRAPSWRIRDEVGSPRHGAHHCWPCGLGGGPPGLVVAMRGCSYRDAYAWLGDDAAPAIEIPDRIETHVVNVHHRGFAFSLGVDFGALDEWPTPPRRYALSRGIEAWQVERWGIGYAIEGRLSGRLVIAYRDADGIARGYTARDYVGQDKRYLEPSSFENPDRNIMFGEQRWSQSRDVVYVTEGAINALAVERAMPGVSLAAIAGSELRTIQAAKLSSFDRVRILTDPDAAGDKAASYLGALGRHCQVDRVRLPVGEDAASLSEEALRALL